MLFYLFLVVSADADEDVDMDSEEERDIVKQIKEEITSQVLSCQLESEFEQKRGSPCVCISHFSQVKEKMSEELAIYRHNRDNQSAPPEGIHIVLQMLVGSSFRVGVPDRSEQSA